MIRILPPIRSDSMGAGYFGAPRGSRTHKGVDFACYPESKILTPCSGEVTKIGYPHASGVGGASDDEPYRYVEVTNAAGEAHRVFYIKPTVQKGDVVLEGRDVIGFAQDVRTRHGQAMTPHVHYEIRVNGEFVSPIKHEGMT